MTQPDDRELERYLAGDSELSRRYRAASNESAPPELDDAILAQARAAVRRRPAGSGRWLAPLALAASLMLGVNLAWNVYRAEPLPPGAEVPLRGRAAEAPLEDAARSRASVPPLRDADAPAKERRDAQPAPSGPSAQPEPFPATAAELESGQPAAPAPEAKRKAEAAPMEERLAAAPPASVAPQSAGEADRQASLEKAQSADELHREGPGAGAAADSAMAAPTAAERPALDESARIDRLIAYIEGLDGAVFIRNGEEHSPAEAAEHLRMKRRKAGDRVRSAEDFIRLCASHSYLSGEAYLIRFADGRTRTAEDVLREHLSRLE